MGCDIHLYVEKQANGAWITCDTWEIEDGHPHVDYKKSFYHDRNYDLFAILADVRNGRGFAGIKTGDGFVPMAEQRGIPDDCCAEYRAASEAYGEDGHSHSWLTVAEIMAYDWTQTTRKEGVVGPREWARWKLYGQPHAYSGDIYGGNVITVTPEELEKAALAATGNDLGWLLRDQTNEIRKRIDAALGGSVHTRVSWEIPYYEAAAKFLGNVLPRLWRLGAPFEVRLCFFFDN